jgi:hypothetical protein
MRAVGVRRVAAIAATAVAMALPWNAWLGVATVPESWAGALVAASIIAMADGRARPWCAGALLAASLSRYEAWPACAMLAAACSAHAPKKSHFAPALVALLGPVLWMAWNLHAHGNALHFIARVSAFRRAIGAADLPLHDKLLAYPRALVTDTPEAALLGLVGLGGLLASDALRARWRLAAAAALGVMAFLIAGDVRDGAPTHHAARALAPEWWVLVGMGIDTIFTFARSAVRPWPGTAVTWVTLAMGFVWCVSLPSRWRCGPGQSDSERRDAQIARGLDMRSRGVVAADITPCQFEHFALLAAWGWPERARVEPRTGESMGPDCPRVVER